MHPEGLIEIGRIVKPWGLRGEVKIVVSSDIPDRFIGLDGIYLHNGGESSEYFPIEQVKQLNDAVAVKLEGIDSVEDAEPLRGLEVGVPEAERAPLGEGEFYIYDLVGLEVFEPDGKYIGRLSKVYQGAAQDVFEIETPEGPVMVPVVEEYVKEINPGQGRVVLTVPRVPAGKEAGE